MEARGAIGRDRQRGGSRPPREECESADLLRAETRARAAVTGLKGFSNIIPNQEILVNALGSLPARRLRRPALGRRLSRPA